MISFADISETVQNVTDCIIKAADASIPKRTPLPRKFRKPWWNDECRNAYKEQRKCWGIFRRYPTTENLVAFKRARANARRIRRRSQKESWQSFISTITSNTSSAQLWKKVKAANGIYKEFAFPILNTETASYSSPLDIANVIGETFADVSSSVPNNPTFRAIKRQAEQVPLKFRTRRVLSYNYNFKILELRNALSHTRDTSPGVDGITYSMLRHLDETSLLHLLHLFNRIWSEQTFPEQWYEAIVIPILKPGKVPTNPSNYRPIALTSCLCKTLERMVNARLLYELEKNGYISPFQSGFRRGRSTNDNLVMLESQIRNAFVRRNHLVSIFFDIEKAYDRTWRYGILRTLGDFGFKERQLQRAVNKLISWCDENGHTLSPEKSRCVHFCRKRSLHPDPVIQIRGVDIPVVEEVRFLGVIFDRKLTFLSHVLHLRKRCEKSLNILKVLSTTRWGADRTSLLRIYQSVILSRIDYGCEIYGTARSGVLRNLDTVHNSALRICSGAFRTSPVHSLNVICHQLPLYLRRKKLSELYFFRIESSINHPIRRINLPIGLGRLYNARPSNILPFRERVKRAFADVNILNLQIHNTTALALPPWDVPEISYLNPFLTYDKSTTSSIVFQQLFLYHRNEYSTHIPVFTDGSKTAYHVGCAVVIAEDTSSFQLSTLCSVLTAELMAIMIALEKISNLSDHKFCIYSDSMSALEALSHPHTKTHPLAIDILHLWRNLQTRNYQILFCWLPGHAGIFGNESADAAAKAASTSLQRPDITLWPVVPVRELDVKLTRLRIGHTRLTHKHLLFGERCPVCNACDVNLTVTHILSECPIFNSHRLHLFGTSSSNIRDLADNRELANKLLDQLTTTINHLEIYNPGLPTTKEDRSQQTEPVTTTDDVCPNKRISYAQAAKPKKESKTVLLYPTKERKTDLVNILKKEVAPTTNIKINQVRRLQKQGIAIDCNSEKDQAKLLPSARNHQANTSREEASEANFIWVPP
ncbi:uncharacterized protein LOC129956736 [Argiope bruennichi]|uniref:uncharacterized protein LOC129956736 n=1 Tax=Argiope bruennichi TaxID=94029 RepID=UPI00249581EC|nr:uncharacterized protein LOC129956736 [Argiope bruennichi]